ncbi:uncharacterized protein K489DRAFT_383897 [Dissoconium aciculare CBS 342.82]|uniref:DUF7580 domain-containing protein n=1 Tax=Dissoconium aciculare CBS 342.82 TaxID=1314786 RepID=A0A6J3LVF0_9PEZI|nr:uncharacterized protein K489DRAFT_383897 [Dissoconium aciculare CBS 342.82]KAF1819648.1 hypothetical protein K489DRAFT_383897 [Dissoconium aciculare CBS 342.82]
MSKLKPIARKWQADLRYESQRFHFVRRRTEREKSLDQIETLMDGLRQILIDHEEIARRWPQLRAQREIPVLYEHAQNVFRLVESVWRCQCASKHCADLRLHHLEHNLVQFDILFRYGETKQRYQQAPWILHETTVEEVTEREEAAVRAPSSRPANFTSVPIPSPPAKAQAGQPSPVSFSYKGRRRANCAGPSGSATKILTQTPIPLVTLPILPQPPDPIDDLCEAISRHSFTPCAGVLAPIRERDIKYKLSACTLGIQRNEETCKLESLLSSTSELTSRKQRYGIALAITSSHLQIHPSPWLGRIWSSEDIHFYMKNGVLELSRPYLRRKFTPADPTEPPRGCRDDTFGSLGILLLELFFNIPLAKSPHRQKYQSPDGKPDFVMDMAAAQMWADVDMEKGNIEKEYAGAVLWCLKKRTLRPQDESTWRQKLHRKVVLPIQNVYEALA